MNNSTVDLARQHQLAVMYLDLFDRRTINRQTLDNPESTLWEIRDAGYDLAYIREVEVELLISAILLDDILEDQGMDPDHRITCHSCNGWAHKCTHDLLSGRVTRSNAPFVINELVSEGA